MTPIPAASIAGIDLMKIRKENESDADEISRLGRELDSESFSDSDFLRLCLLLIKHNERYKAKGLLLANCEDSKELLELFQREFPECQMMFERAVKCFELQFYCKLTHKENYGHLNSMYKCDPVQSVNTDYDCVRELLLSPEETEAQILYDIDQGVVGDIHAVDDPTTLQLAFDRVKWIVENEEFFRNHRNA